MPYNYRRTIDDATEMIIHAKQKEDEVNPVTQVFYYPSSEETLTSKETVKLLDIDERLIEMLENGESLAFKGCDDEKLVLCTESETFEVKEGEISNSLMICPDLLYNADLLKLKADKREIKELEVCGIYNSYLELRPTFPRVNKLRHLLNEGRYKGPENEDEMEFKGYYLTELLDRIQCSRKELLISLKEIMACCINERWRLLDIHYESKVLTYIINLMEEKGWDTVSAKESKRYLNSLVPDYIIDHIILHFTAADEKTEDSYSWKEDKVCRSFAEMLLRTGEGNIRHNEFMIALKQCLPPGTNADLNHLKGLALVEKEGMQQPVIRLFPEYDLPENIADRFAILFKRKEKWTMDEIRPYIENLATKSMNVNTMLTKFSRASTINGLRVFGARHAN